MSVKNFCDVCSKELLKEKWYEIRMTVRNNGELNAEQIDSGITVEEEVKFIDICGECAVTKGLTSFYKI